MKSTRYLLLNALFLACLTGCWAAKAPTPTPTAADTRTLAPTRLPTQTATVAPTLRPTLTASPTPTASPRPTITPTSTATPTFAPDFTGTPTWTPTAQPLGVQWECWDDGSPDPCHREFNAITFSSATDGWVVGEAGVILHWDGLNWRLVDSPSDYSFIDVVALAPDDAWISGYTYTGTNGKNDWHFQGVLLHWDGYRLSEFPTPGHNNILTSMSFSDANDGWAFSSAGQGPVAINGVPITTTQVVHWDGVSWRASVQIHGAYKLIMLSKTNGWILGGYPYHWDGEEWKETRDLVHFNLYGVDFIQTPDGWAFNDIEPTIDLVLKWDGAAWQPYLSGKKTISQEMILVDAENGWHREVRQRPPQPGQSDLEYRLFRWNGREWAVYELKAPRQANGFAAIDKDHVWAISGNVLWRWNGSYWQTYHPPQSHSTNAFAFASDQDAWTVGVEGNIWHWNGISWKQAYSPNPHGLNDVVFLSPTDGWAVGDGAAVLHWDGKAWKINLSFQPSEDSPRGFVLTLSAATFANPNDGWAIGDVDTEGGGLSLMLHWNGSTWEAITEDSQLCGDCIPITGEISARAGEGWAVGLHGALHWDGSQWGYGLIPDTAWLNSVSIVAKNDVWAAGATNDYYYGALVLHWNGQEWDEIPLPPDAPHLYTIKMISSSDGWAMGDYGEMYHWDGIAWRPVYRIVTQRIVDLQTSPDGQLWAITENGVLLHLVSNAGSE